MELTIQHWREWCDLEEMRRAQDRSRKVHGVGYGAYVAVCQMLEIPLNVKEFQSAAVGHAVKADTHVKEQVNVNKFWQVLIEAYKLGVFGNGASARKYFRAIGEEVAHPPGAPTQAPGELTYWMRWTSYTLYMDVGPICGELQEFLRKRGEALPLNRTDLHDQMAAQPYWKPGSHKQRFANGSTTTKCWGIRVDLHPDGYVPVSDPDLIQSKQEGGTDWIDPRKGDLFRIINDVIRAEQGKED